MKYDDTELNQLILGLPYKEKRSQRRYLTYSIIMLLIGALWMAASYYQVRNLQEQIRELERQLGERNKMLSDLNIEFDQKQQLVQEASSILGLSAEDVSFLKSYDFLSKGAATDIKTVVDVGKKAKAEIDKFHSPEAERRRRSGITIKYYRRVLIESGVQAAMKKLETYYGFKTISDIGSEPSSPTNAVWINSDNLKEEDIKIVVYQLMIYGNQIKYIGPPTSTPERIKKSPAKILAVAEPKVNDESPLTVENIRDLSLKQLKVGTKKVK